MSMKTDWEAANSPFILDRMVFINTDETGKAVYRFEYAITTGFEAKLGYTGSVTQSVDSTTGGWTFAKPDYTAEGKAPAAEGLAAQLGQDRFGREDVGGGFVRRVEVDDGRGGSETAAERLAFEKAWVTIERWVAEGRFPVGDYLPEGSYAEGTNPYEPYTGKWYLWQLSQMTDLHDIEAFTNVLPPSSTEEKLQLELDLGGISDGGGGRAAAIGPIYRAPDRRTIEDQITGTLVALLGTVDESLVQEFTNLHMKEDKRNWDSPTETINPSQSVLEAIRNTSQYKTIHKLRPDSEDERTWISMRRAAALRGGLNTGDLEQYGIRAAKGGFDLGDVPLGAATTQFGTSGKAPPLLDEKFRRVAKSMFGRVIR